MQSVSGTGLAPSETRGNLIGADGGGIRRNRFKRHGSPGAPPFFPLLRERIFLRPIRCRNLLIRFDHGTTPASWPSNAFPPTLSDSGPKFLFQGSTLTNHLDLDPSPAILGVSNSLEQRLNFKRHHWPNPHQQHLFYVFSRHHFPKICPVTLLLLVHLRFIARPASAFKHACGFH
jgi:hypothetical protein